MTVGYRGRLVLALSGVFVLIWGGGSFFLSQHLTQELDNALRQQAATTARSFAMWSEEAVLTESRVELLRLIAQTRASNPDVAYVFVTDEQGNVLAHSFESGFPSELQSATRGRPQTLLDTERGSILDFRAPILRGRGGEAHVGYSRRRLLEGKERVRNLIWLVAAGVFLAGIAAVLFVSRVFTRPAIHLTRVAERLGAGDLSARVEGDFKGEFKTLANAFDGMAESLESGAERLRYLTEYNQNLIDHLGVDLYVMGADLRVEYANRDALADDGPAMGRHCGEVFGCGGTPCSDCPAARALSDRRVHSTTRTAADGKRIEQTALSLRQPDGSLSAVVTSRDVTESARMRERVARSEKLAAVGELAAAVAHEVNNPLDGMQSLVRLVLDDPATQVDVREQLAMVEGGLQRIEVCVRRLLTFAADPGERTVSTTVAEQLEHTLALAGPALRAVGVRTSVEIQEGVPPLQVEPDRFPQLLVNLLLSAADTVAEGGAIAISATHDAEGHLIVIENRGPGAPPEHRGRLFLPFFVPKGPGRASVLGLAVSRRIAEEHGGFIRERAAPGGGAAFELRIPTSEVHPRSLAREVHA